MKLTYQEAEELATDKSEWGRRWLNASMTRAEPRSSDYSN